MKTVLKQNPYTTCMRCVTFAGVQYVRNDIEHMLKRYTLRFQNRYTLRCETSQTVSKQRVHGRVLENMTEIRRRSTVADTFTLFDRPTYVWSTDVGRSGSEGKKRLAKIDYHP